MFLRLMVPAAASIALMGATLAQAQVDPDPLNPDLIYDPVTGGVSIDADGATILTFVLNSEGKFLTNFTQEQLKADTLGLDGIQDNTPSVIGWASGVALANIGYTGANFDPAFIGNIFPTGLDLDGLGALLTRADWAGPNGAGSAFEITLVPEPGMISLAVLGGLGLLARRRAC